MPYVITSKETDRERPSSMLLNAVCTGFLPMGLEENFNKNGYVRKLVLTFETEEKMKEGEYAGKPFFFSQKYTESLHEKSNLRRDLESWRGKSLSEVEVAGFDIEKVVGVPCTLALVENTKGGNTYLNIGNILSIQSGARVVQASGAKPPDWLLEQQAKGMALLQEREAVTGQNVAGEEDQTQKPLGNLNPQTDRGCPF